MKNFVLYVYKLGKRFTDSDMAIYAAHASFFMFIAAFPLIMFIMSILQFIPGLGKEDVLRALFNLLPDMPQIEELIISIVDNLYIQSASVVASLAAVTTLVSASTGVFSIERSLRKIYGIQKGNYFVNRVLAIGYTVLFIAVFIITLVLLVLGKLIQGFLTAHFPLIAGITIYVLNVSGVISIGILFVFFLLIYTIMPGKLQNMRRQIPGAIFTTLCWTGFSYLFSFYFTHINGMSSYLYGSLTAIILILLWLYVMICFLFIGGIINTMELPLFLLRHGTDDRQNDAAAAEKAADEDFND